MAGHPRAPRSVNTDASLQESGAPLTGDDDDVRTPGERALGRSGVIAVGGLIVLIAWAAWPLGSNRPWSLALLEFSVAVLIGYLCLRAALGRGRPTAHQRGAAFALAALLVWMSVVAAALYPWPTIWLAALNPHVADLQSVRPGIHANAPLSVDPGSTVRMVLKYAAYAGAFWLTLVLGCTRKRVVALTVAMLGVCTAQGVLGTLQQLAGPDAGLWNPGFAAGYAAGSYVGRNHYAGMLILGLGLATGLALSGTRQPGAPGMRGWLESLVRFLMGHGAWLAFALACMAAGLMLSGSRGAFGAWFVAASSAVLWQRGIVRKARPAVLTAGVMLIAAWWVGPDNLLARVSELGLDSNRPALARATADLIGQSPWFGAGAGSFEWRFPAAREVGLGAFYYQHAHNDVLEMVAELGLVGAIPLYVAIGFALVRAIVGARHRHDRLARGIATGSAIGSIAFLLHGLVDFNLQIPANGFYFFVLLALGMSASDRVCMPAAADAPERRYDRARWRAEALARPGRESPLAGVVSHLDDRREKRSENTAPPADADSGVPSSRGPDD